MKESEICFSDVLKDSGYRTGYIGKWHLDLPYEPFIPCENNNGSPKWNEWCPPERRHGFDEWYAYGTYDKHLRPMYWSHEGGRDDFQYVDQWGPEHEADKACDFLRKQDPEERPFCLVVSMNPPHTPYNQVPEKYRDLYRDLDVEKLCRERPGTPGAEEKKGKIFHTGIRDYYAMISGVDDQFGRLLDCLEETGQADNTVVVFTSDHGDCMGRYGVEHKPSFYEDAMQVPFLIRWPENIPARHDDLLISTPDIYPTLLDLMGQAGKIPPQVQGISHALSLRGEQDAPRPTSQLYIKIEQADVLQGWRGVRTHQFTYAIHHSGGKEVLFDRIADPHELENLVACEPDTLHSLRQELQCQLRETEDPFEIPDQMT